MNKEFIPYEQALELKQLGFTESTFGVYANGNLLFVYKNEKVNYRQESNYCTAPLYQQAFRFLNKITDKWLIPIPNDDYKGEWYGVGISYKTFEEAQHACLLRFIEIAKQK